MDPGVRQDDKVGVILATKLVIPTALPVIPTILPVIPTILLVIPASKRVIPASKRVIPAHAGIHLFYSAAVIFLGPFSTPSRLRVV